MEQASDDSMDDFDDDVMDDSPLIDTEDEKKPSKVVSLASRRRIEDLMERKRLAMQLRDDFYDLDLPDDLYM